MGDSGLRVLGKFCDVLLRFFLWRFSGLEAVAPQGSWEWLFDVLSEVVHWIGRPQDAGP